MSWGIFGFGSSGRTAINGQHGCVAALLRACSALAFGLLAWVTAHGLSSWLFGHVHVHGEAEHVWRMDRHSGTAALFLGCLAFASLAALLTGTASRTGRARSSRASVRTSSLLSTGAFVATDFTERAVSGEYAVPPLLVLIMGAAVYALVGAGASLLWHRCAEALPCIFALLEDKRPKAVRSVTLGPSRLVRPRPRHWSASLAERAPPTAV